MSGDTVATRIEQYVSGHFPAAKSAKVDGNSSLIEGGILDSLGVLDLVQYLEDEFKIDVKDDELVPENFDTINILASFVESKLNGK